MIRINLLAVERGATTRAALVPAAHRVAIAATVILLATALSVGWWSWSLRRASEKLDEALATADAETRQLRSVLAQVQMFETRRTALHQRVTLIEQLRRGQTGPVRVLDEIARALPGRLWLTELSQKGDELRLTGMATSLAGVSDLVANLEASAWFRKPVDIIDSEISHDPPAGGLVKFSVRATVNSATAQ